MLTKIISEAKRALATQPYDVVHDVGHHYKVWENCLWLVREEDLAVDLEALQIAAWWHDYERGKETFKLLKRTLRKFGHDSKFSDKVVQIIQEHSFNKRQTMMEAEVLFDADKLEYIAVARWSEFLQAVADGSFPQRVVSRYTTDFNQRISQIPKRLHFKGSKKRFNVVWREFKVWEKTRGIMKDGKVHNI